MTEPQDIPITAATHVDHYSIKDLAPTVISCEGNQATVVQAVWQNLICADFGEGTDNFLCLITVGSFGSQLLGVQSPMTPEEARSLAASLIQGADDCEARGVARG